MKFKTVKIKDIVNTLNCEIITGGKSDYVKSVISSGLMSDVLTTDREEFLLITGLTTPQVVRTADMVEAHAILITNGKNIPDDTVNLAEELGITILRTGYPNFEASVILGNLFTVDK